MIKRYAGRLAWILFVLATTVIIAHAATSYVGSKNSNKYHYPSCVWAERIKPGNRITFSSAKEARAAGYVPCKVCRPPLAD